MNVTRRSFVGAAGVAAALGLAACGSSNASSSSSAGSAAGSAAAGSSAASTEVEAVNGFDPNDAKTVYVSPSWVKSVIDGNEDASKSYVLMEVGWGEVEDDTAYTEAHIPGAVHMNTDYIEEPEKWNYRTPEEFTELFKNYGMTQDTTVIVYGAKGTDSADDRMAWAALWAGVKNVKALDGGLEAWTAAGYDTETTVNDPKPTEEDFGVTIPAHPEYVLSIDEVKDKLANDQDFRLCSVRSYKEYCGETSGYSYIDRAGEPKGAVWAHDTDDGSYFIDGATVTTDKINEYLKDYDASTDNSLAFYCGTGWRATIPCLICYQEGVKEFALYDGGWFEWQMDGANEVQLGDPTKGDVQYVTVADLSTDKAVKS